MNLESVPLVLVPYAVSRLALDLSFLASGHSSPCAGATRASLSVVSLWHVLMPRQSLVWNLVMRAAFLLEARCWPGQLDPRPFSGLHMWDRKPCNLSPESGSALSWIWAPGVMAVGLPAFCEYFLLVTSSSFSLNHLTNGNNVSLHSYEWEGYRWKVAQYKQANVETAAFTVLLASGEQSDCLLNAIGVLVPYDPNAGPGTT